MRSCELHVDRFLVIIYACKICRGGAAGSSAPERHAAAQQDVCFLSLKDKRV